MGLSGYARCGKNEAARGLEKIGFRQVAFADKLRDVIYALNPIVDIQSMKVRAFAPDERVEVRVQDVIDKYGWDGYKSSVYGSELRRLLQRMGTECGREILYDSIWVDATFNNLEGDVVITDLRFENEARAIKARGGIIIRIERPGVGPVNDHPSETALDNWPWDFIVNNDRDIQDLHREVRGAVMAQSLVD